VSAAYPLQPAEPSEVKSSAFGTASAVFAVLTILLPVFVMTWIGVKASNDPNERARDWLPVLVIFVGGFIGLMASGITSVLGTIAGTIALARHEPKRWLATTGLIICVPIALFALFVFASLRPASS
jgi:hypothetical protein